MKRLQGRVAVVTGAANGIGRATCLRLAQRGCAIAAADIDTSGLETLAQEIATQREGASVSIHTVDVSSRDAMEAFASEVERQHGAAHILINNAGVVVVGEVAEQSLDDLEWMVGINYWGVVYGCHFFLPLLERQDEAHIVNLSSMFGFLGLPSQSGYCATKAAVKALSESLWTELRTKGVGVTSIHPGCIDTSIIRAGRMGDEETRQEIQGLFNQRGAPPDTVAEAILRGIEKNKLRIRVRPESVVTDWLKRLAPVGLHRWVARRWQRDLAQRAAAHSSDNPQSRAA